MGNASVIDQLKDKVIPIDHAERIFAALPDRQNRWREVVEGYHYDAYGRHTLFEPGDNGMVDFGGDDVVIVEGVGAVANPYLFPSPAKPGGHPERTDRPRSDRVWRTGDGRAHRTA